jgi:PAS domain S-box-containing protein
MRAKEPDTRINNKVMSNDAINGVVTRSHLRLIFGASLFMRGTTKGYYRLSVLSIAVMLLVIGFAEYQYNQKTVDAAQWLSHTHQVLDNLESVRSLYTGHFVALHSVLPPANQRPLLHNQSLKSGLEPKLNELFTLIKDNPDQVKLVEKLRIAIAQQSDVLQTDRLVPDNKLEYQQQIVLNIIADIRANEIVLFGQREARNKTYIEQTNKIFTVAIIFGLLITFFFHIVLDFSERKRNLAEQRVRKDRDYFESIFQSLREPVLILNEKFIVQALNQAYLDHFKCKYVDIVGQPVREINNGIWNDDALLAMLQSVYQKNAPLSEYDYAVIRSTYQSVQFSLGARIISSADEANKQIILTIVDLTEKKKAEMEREHFFRLSPEMLAVIDREGTLLATNPAWQRVMGYSERDLTGHLLIDFLHPDDRAAFSRFLSVEDKELLSLNIENRLRSKNGDFRWFNWNCFLSNPDSEIFIAAHDLTEVKMASLQLEEYAAVNLDLYENAPCGYYELNADGQIVRINRTFIEMLGYSREELLGKSIYDFVSGYVPNGKNFQERLAETIDDEAFQANFIKKKWNFALCACYRKTSLRSKW